MNVQLLIGCTMLSLAFILFAGCTNDETPVEEPIVADDSIAEAPPPADDFDDFSLNDEPSQIMSMEAVYFDYNTANLKPEAKLKLDELASQLRDQSSKALQLEGHCDERGTQNYNYDLGRRRAVAVRNHLMKAGISGDRLSLISYGEDRPALFGSDESAWSQNRRVEFSTITH